MSSLPELEVPPSSTTQPSGVETVGDRPTKFSAGVITRLFEEQVEHTPEKVAVNLGGQNLTYAELNDRANRIAHYLAEMGVTIESMVGVYMDRSMDAIASILGILKAGGVYVPIDPIYPRERIEFILEDAQMGIVLTQRSRASALPQSKLRLIAIDDEWDVICTQPATNPKPALTKENAAYVIYTSGSTGKPKGVVVTHHNVVRLFGATDDFFQFAPSDVWTLFHSFTFDLSVWEMWGAFFYGGRLVIVPYLTSRSPQAFYELLSREQATVLTQTPSAFRQLIWADESSSARLPLELRYVVLAGEALELGSLRPWFHHRGDNKPAIINMYGITETTVHVTHRRIWQADLNSGLGSVIGPPMSDLTLHVLDEKQKPCAVGQAGEIYVGGPGVARGYLNRPELNAAKFIGNPLTGWTDDRVYRSGDLARRLENGEIEFLGRMDHQVKIRGFRVELGEIQAALDSHSGIRESVIVPQADPNQGTRLIAYFVPRQENLSVEDLRAFLGKTLPEYMVPAIFLSLPAMPLTLNGKIDRRALPSPDGSRPELTTSLVPASTPKEKILTAIWNKTLQLKEVGVHDNFFALGGDSIRSIHVLADAKREGVKLSLQTLFERPTIYELARADDDSERAEAAPQPFALIAASDAGKMPPEIEDAYPMGKLQLGMVFHSGSSGGSAIFHDVFSYHIHFPFDQGKFQTTVEHLIRRHSIFRTAFDLAAFSEPLQVIYAKIKASFTLEDLTGLAAKDQDLRLREWIEKEKRNPFDWSCPPFTRFHVQVRSACAFQLVVSFHHSVMDGWSLAAMLTELMQEYEGLLTGRAIDLGLPLASYRDFIAMERQATQSSATRAFWNQKTMGAPETKLPRWPVSLRKGGLEQRRGPEILMDADTLAKLKNLAQSRKVPLKSILLAAHCRVMSLLSGENEVVTALIANGRPQTADGQRVIGLFLNALPFRIGIGEGTWSDLIGETFNREKELIPHRRLPLSEIKQLQDGNLALESAFDFVQFHTFLDVPGFKEGKFVEDRYFEANDFDLYTTFLLSAGGSSLEMHFDYNPNEFCEDQIQWMCGYYRNALSAMACSPDSQHAEQDLLPRDERARLLVEWNQTAEEFPQCCIHALVEAQAAQTPDRIAAVYAKEAVTYRELNDRAGRLAALLRRRGVGPEVIAGVCVERSLDMLVSVLAVLKSGGAYLPLDPSYPPERIRFMLEDSGARVVVTERNLLQALISDNRDLVCVDAEFDAPGPVKSEAAPARVNLENLAYLIYTSGSTGKPKAVEIPHRAVANFLHAMKSTAGIRPDDRWLAVTTLSFDIAALELFLPLTSGARVVISDTETVINPVALAGELESNGITIMQATPVVWRSLTDSGWKGKRDLKALCGGEKLDPELARKLAEGCGELWNLYGPTETTIWSSVQKIHSQLNPVPIGRPIANTQMYILNGKLQPVPTGATGEVFIGGAGVARGYFRRPELTQERFLSDPFVPGGRLYRTGDIGKYQPDGTIVIVGRLDQQVKFHGHRIELGEIEAAMLEHSLVSAAVVILRENDKRERQLVGYWTPHRGESKPKPELRAWLEERLPRYMVPGALVQLEVLPLTPNGKIDRKRLPDPERAGSAKMENLRAPRNALEKFVSDSWKEVLQLDRIGIEDDFFDLGGDSLRAARIIARLRQRMEIDVSFATIFQHRTVERFAEYLTTELSSRGKRFDEGLGLVKPDSAVMSM